MVMQKITFRKHLKHICPYLLFSFIMWVLIIYDWVNSGESNKTIYFIYVVLGVVSIINLYVHLEYYFFNRGIQLIVDGEKMVVYLKRGREQSIVISPETVARVEIHQSRFYKRKGGFLTTDNYRFHKFILQNGDTVVITSLLYPDLEYTQKEMTVTKEKTVASILIR